MLTIKNILVATDFSEAAEAALLYGRALARAFTATLHVVHVSVNTSSLAYGADGYVATLSNLQLEIDDAARTQLDELLVSNERPLPMRKLLTGSNTPAESIVEYARQEHIDLIVAGTRGRGAVAHLLMGSVAERIVRIAQCPVLTVRHPEHEFVTPDGPVAATRA